jgi:hypothetical protein
MRCIRAAGSQAAPYLIDGQVHAPPRPWSFPSDESHRIHPTTPSAVRVDPGSCSPAPPHHRTAADS